MPEIPNSPALRILVVDDEENIRMAVTMCLEAEGHHLTSAGTIESALEAAARQAFDLIYLDVRLGTQNGLDYIKTFLEESPWTRIIVITAYASIETAVEAMKLGATDYLPKPFEPAQLRLLTQRVAERRSLERRLDALQKTLGAMDPEADFSTASPVFRESLELARRVADTHAPILILGEAGVGKGRLARAIHQWSGRGPFAAVCVEDKSVDALEAELFGSGAGTGAGTGAGPDVGGKTGAVPFCHGGTLFLDDITRLPLRLQPRVLALLRDKEYERPDAFARRPVDVRIIAATDASPAELAHALQMGHIREDLLMTLSVVQIDVPALRERGEDILPLADRYLAHYTREHHRRIAGFTPDAIFVLKTYSWPGNIRELRNIIERAVLHCDSELIDLRHLPPDLVNAGNPSALPGYQVGDLVPLHLIEELHIQQVMASAKTLRRAAAILGVNASALCRKMKRRQAEATQNEPEQNVTPS